MKPLIVALLLLPAGAAAEQPVMAWSDHRPLADWMSTGLVGFQLGADSIHSWRAERRGRAFLNQGCRWTLVLGTSALSKRYLPRTRPDQSDRHSFWSEHTALGTTAAGWRYEIGIPIAAATGLLRGAAAKHYLSDVGVGALNGALSSLVCRRLS